MRSLLKCALAGALFVSLAAVAADDGQSRPVVEAAFTVPANSFKEYRFNIPAGLKQAHLVGHFRATGGVHNDIVVCVMNDDQFVNWRNNPIQLNPVKTYFRGALYDSGKVTQGTIKLGLTTDPTLYHVVFYNGFSMLTPKAVEASVNLEYMR